jgi:fused signal recognition particle receptor
MTLAGRLNALFSGRKVIDPSVVEELEEILFTSDIGVETTEQLIEHLREGIDRKSLERPDQLKTLLQQEMVSFLKTGHECPPLYAAEKVRGNIWVIMFVGVNGVGKTSTIAKMARYYQSQGQRVMLVAADTFRAAAIEQLQIWGDRVGAEVISQKRGADPAAVVFDALSAAKGRNLDGVLIDTAGRLHTKSNLMEELKKIQRVAGEQITGAPHRVTLVLDATTGQNAVVQSQVFAESLGVTDIILTKLDGTAKGGVAISVAQKRKIPISFICTGESLEDFQVFNPGEFVEALFA